MLELLRRIGNILKEAGERFEVKCPGCGKVFKGQGMVQTCDQCGTRLQGGDE